MACRRIFKVTAVAFLLTLVVAAGSSSIQTAAARPAFQLKVSWPSSAEIGETAAVRVVVRRTSGAAIKGARVRFSWNIAGTTHTVVGRTSSKGVAVSSSLMTCGGDVVVRVRATWNGRARAAVPAPQWYVPGST